MGWAARKRITCVGHCLAVSALAISALAAVAPAWAGKAHEHGVAQLLITVEVGRITLRFEFPLEVLTGFERAPRSDAERAAVAAALARLQEVDKLVRIDRAGGCGPGKVGLRAPAWGASGAGPAAASASEGAAGREAHDDLEASYEFRCNASPRAGFVEVALFDAFARLRRVEVQAAALRGQMKLALRRPHTRIGLAR